MQGGEDFPPRQGGLRTTATATTTTMEQGNLVVGHDDYGDSFSWWIVSVVS